ncbi:MAG: choice-of-anchor B family protein [Flavobacteriales bacterium]|nr:choice-of-anchor B family protein [Flavobacteriales bacterium]
MNPLLLVRRLMLIGLVLLSCAAFAQIPCENGLAGGVYPCDNVDLLGTATQSDMGAAANVEMNDIWGWTDALDGKEYVILGRTDGTSFFDISDPLNPIHLGFLPTFTTSSLWRDIKTYGDYAFIVSEAGGHGMQVFDLTRLRNVANPPETFTEDAHYNGFGNAHNIVINPDVALAYGVGTNTFSGGFHVVDISDPLNPTIAGDFASDGYTHDAQVITYNGPDATYVGKQIGMACNEDTFTIVDLDDPTDAQQIARVGYSNVAYAHQGWLTPDHRYFVLGDELDENNFGNNTRSIIWDIQDLDNPVVIGEYLSSEAAIDHNMYSDGNLMFQANYRAGLRILDTDDIANANLSEVAFFDLYPASNSAAFNGAWSSYPYFESGVVAVSHIEEGLFLLYPTFIEASVPQTDYCYEDDVVIDIVLDAGFAGPINMSVSNGLPAGATATFSANGVGPGSYTLTLSNLPDVTGTLDIEISAVGAFFTYRAEVSFMILDCVNDVLGCTDPTATNYNPAATIDDGSCTYPCIDITLQIDTDCWGEETSWTLNDAAGNNIFTVAGNTLTDQTTFTWDFCLQPGCYDWNIADSFGDGLAGIASGCAVDGNYQVLDAAGDVILAMGDPNFGGGITENFCVELPVDVSGCTDPTACNYDPAATTDDGSCILPDGCTDATACNYDPAALCDNGSCILPNGCTDATACNYDPAATCDDGSCQLPDGCTDTSACNYDPMALCDDGSCVLPQMYYADNDNDTFGAGLPVLLCSPQAGFVLQDGDCDDNNNMAYPGAPGTAEGIDNNCNGTIDLDEEIPASCFGDFNNDGLINASDLLTVLGDFGCVSNCNADLNDDDIVNASDILIFLGLFGTICP